jgi:hypothetical protein
VSSARSSKPAAASSRASVAVPGSVRPCSKGEFGRRTLYDIEIRRRGARRVKAADGIRSKREAEWLCAAIAGAVRRSRAGTA